MDASEMVPAPRLGELLNMDRLNQHIDEHTVTCRPHPTLDLLVLNYTPKAQYHRIWDRETTLCRGLVVTEGPGGRPSTDSIVVARPFAKFFTVNQHEQLAAAGVLAPLPNEKFTVSTKEDGALGIAYPGSDSRPEVTTRGAFTSPQAQWATEFLRRSPDLEQACERMLLRGTPCFEIIARVSRVVKDYDFDGLVLLALLDRRTGKELPAPEWPGPRAHSVPPAPIEKLQQRDIPNQEGYVLKFRPSGIRAKIKFPTYELAHRLVTSTSRFHVWQRLAANHMRNHHTPEAQVARTLRLPLEQARSLSDHDLEELEKYRQGGTKEFRDWLDSTIDDLKRRHSAVWDEARRTYENLPTCENRAAFAAAVNSDVPAKFRPAMFRMFEGKDPVAEIWKLVRPPKVD